MNLFPVLILAVCFISGFPIAFSLILCVIPYFLADPYMALETIIQRLVSNTESVSLLAIPFFTTAGAIMNHSGITTRLMALADGLVGHMTGGLGHVNVILSTLMGGVSGSGAADAAMESKLLVPEMTKRGYDLDFSCAITAASSCITPIIPPGIGLVIYACLLELSVGKMLCTGYIPGLFMAVGLMIAVHFISKNKGYAPSRSERAKGKELWTLFKAALWALFLPFGLVLGLRIGMFSATEGGALMCIYSLIVGLFIYKEMSLRDLPKIILEATLSTATVMVIMCAANLFSYYLSWERIPYQLSQFITSAVTNKYVFLLLVNVLFLILGMFLDGTASMIILAPLFAPIAKSLGIDLLHFGLILCLNISIGSITPPFGMYLYVVSSTAKCKIGPIIKAMLPFIGVLLIVLLLMTYIPGLVTFIPELLF